MASPANILARRGWLSLNQFVEHLRLNHPEHHISYPTALKMVKEKKLRAMQVGGTHRLYQEEITRYLREGNYVPQPSEDLPKELVQAAKTIQATRVNPLSKSLVQQAPLPEDDT
jgi:excisionase family DNA binding protein